jgi:hypothetical protein
LLVLLVLAAAAALGGVLADFLKNEPEEGLFLKGMGYALMGNFLITISSVPILATQTIGAIMAANSPMNRRSRWAAWGLGLAFRAVSFLFQ